MKNKCTKPDKSIFKDRDKEAQFWEENIDEVLSCAKPIKVRFAKNLSETINIRLDPKTMEVVRNKAQEKGLGPTQLIRMWIMERVGKHNMRINT